MIQAAPEGGMLEAGWGGKQNLNQNLHRMFHFRVIIKNKLNVKFPWIIILPVTRPLFIVSQGDPE